MVCTTIYSGFFTFCKYLSHTCRPFPTSRSPLNIILTYLLSGVRLAFPPNLGVFFLHEQALLAVGLVSTCSLATTLSIAVRCNIAIRPKSVRYTLVACDVKYIFLLMTILAIAVLRNTAIRPESVHCALMTCGQVFVYCSVTTLGITLCCNIHQIKVCLMRVGNY